MSESTPTPVPLVAIVGDQLRHRWYVERLRSDPRLELRGVVVEQKRPRPSGATAAESETIASHFEERSRAEKRFFGSSPRVDEAGVESLPVEHGRSNDESVARWVHQREPRLLTLFGCSIIREPLLADFEGRTINIHLGLSPYYRGAATNFWPLVNGEPECVGATVHIATLQVDAGPILLQRRPHMEADDGPHDIGCRALISGVDGLVDAIASFDADDPGGQPQKPGGRLYKNADFHAGAVDEMRRRFREGMIPDYLDHREERDRRFPIVE